MTSANLHVQPQNLDAEISVLGSMLSTKEAASKVQQWLTPDHFYKDAHQKIYSAMLALDNAGQPIDTLTVIDKLKKSKDLESVGGAYYITGLVEAVPSASNVETYAKIVLEKALLRQLIVVSHEITQQAFDDREDLDDILEAAERDIFQLSENRLRGGFKPIKNVMIETFEMLDKISAHKGAVVGVPSGIIKLDEKTAGFQDGDLIIIAGRPGMGKTALALTLARNAAVDSKFPVGIFSLEMSNKQLAMRLLCSEARVDSHQVRTGSLPKTKWQELSRHVSKLTEAQIFLDDTPAITVLELRAKARRLKHEHDVKLIIVDYLQLMQGPKGAESRQQEISIISRSLKALAKELDLPVIALSQLSRAVENRTDKHPILADLRESGAIEQDADVVIFLYRPEFYTKDSDDEGKAEIILAKQRNGPTGNIHANFIGRYTRFENPAPEDMEALDTPF
ncbi:MAG: replicative DNA helicase [FCB group bacterium]|nr:replicative DNA helicase [FCB group bacterium]